MYYPFPYIKHIDQVKEALAGCDEFIISEKPEGFTVANYLVNLEDTFPKISLDENGNFASKQDEMYAIRRECRGIKFDSKTGLVIARLFHKFFNLQEREETRIDDDFDLGVSDHYVLAKYDGSMIAPVFCKDRLYWCTKMGVTDISKMAEQFIEMHPAYIKLAYYCIDQNQTPIFEFCSRKNRVVIDYPEDKLILLAIRENYSGQYLSLLEIENILSRLQVPIPRVTSNHFQNEYTFNSWLDYVRNLKNEEGYIIRFFNGHMLKVKSSEYLKIHAAKDDFSREKAVIDLIISEKTDDLKPFLQDDDLKRLNKYENEFWLGVADYGNQLEKKFLNYYELAQGDKKTFAVNYVSKEQGFFKPLLFQMWDGKKSRDMILAVIKKHLSSQTEVDKIREIFNTTWN